MIANFKAYVKSVVGSMMFSFNGLSEVLASLDVK